MYQLHKNKIAKPLIVAGLAGSLLFTSACSSDSSAEGSSNSETQTVVVDGVEYGPTIEGMPTLKELASDSKGQWRKTTILPDDPAFDYDPSVVVEGMETIWTEEEVKEGHRLAVEMAVDAIDTSANGAPNDSDSKIKWWEANKDKIDPVWQQDIYNALISDDPNAAVVFKGTHREKSDSALSSAEGYSLVYGEDEVHVKDRKIETTKIDAGQIGDRNGLVVELAVDFVNVAEIDGKKQDEAVEGKLIYHMVKDEETGKFLISGIQPEYRYMILQ